MIREDSFSNRYPELNKNELPFSIGHESLVSDKGHEFKVSELLVEDAGHKGRRIAFKEAKLVELDSEAEMLKEKRFYESLKKHPKFGKFVVETNFVIGKRKADDERKAFRVQKLLKGKPIAEVPNGQLYGDAETVKQLIEFIDASLAILEEQGEKATGRPDLLSSERWSNTIWALANFLHNPRYSNNILISDKETEHSGRVHFIDTAPMGFTRNIQSGGKKLAREFFTKVEDSALPLQIFQLKRWRSKLQKISARLNSAT